MAAKVIRAVDVGSSNTKFTTTDIGQDDSIGVSVFPSEIGRVQRQIVGAGATRLPGSRRVVEISVDGQDMLLGPDVLSMCLPGPRVRHDRYAQTNEHRALLLAAVYFMGLPEIDELALGLPPMATQASIDAVSNFAVGRHRFSDGSECAIKNVSVEAQGRGAAYDLFILELNSGATSRAKLAGTSSLVIDIGSYTFDFVVFVGVHAQGDYAGTYDLGTGAAIERIARKIKAEIGKTAQHAHIERAILQGLPLEIGGQQIDLTPHLPEIVAVANQAASKLLADLPSNTSFDRVLLTGGGARWFKRSIEKQLQMPAQIMPDPQFSNVRGFHRFAVARSTHA